MTDEETDTVAEMEPCTWRHLVALVTEMESRPDAIALLHLVDLTDGLGGVTVDVEALAARLDVTVSTTKALLARLEEDGWVTRRAALADGRPVLVFDTAAEVQ